MSLLGTECPLISTVSQVIALKIRRPNSERPYLFPQLFVGLSYLIAALIMFELRRVTRKRPNQRNQ